MGNINVMNFVVKKDFMVKKNSKGSGNSMKALIPEDPPIPLYKGRS